MTAEREAIFEEIDLVCRDTAQRLGELIAQLKRLDKPEFSRRNLYVDQSFKQSNL